MESCCIAEPVSRSAVVACPGCGRAGRSVDRITVKALLRPKGLARLSALEHRCCGTPDCRVVYYGSDEVFDRDDVSAAVFQKERPGARTVCYCFAITEEDIRRELVETGHSTAAERITELVRRDRCACEIKNPQGSCCLGNVATVTQALKGRVGEAPVR